MQLSKEFGFSIPNITITNEQQKLIIQHMKDQLNTGKIKPVGWGYNGEEFGHFWLTKHLREIVDKKTNRTFTKRMDPNFNWTWKDDPIVEIIKPIAEPLLKVFDKFTRMFILLQIPGTTLPLHVDYGDEFPEIHKQNKYLGFKLPLTEIPGNNGLPLIHQNTQNYKYDVGNSAFALNEIEIRHGAAPVDFYRGVLFFDGIVNHDKIAELKIEHIDLKLIDVKMPLYDK